MSGAPAWLLVGALVSVAAVLVAFRGPLVRSPALISGAALVSVGMVFADLARFWSGGQAPLLALLMSEVATAGVILAMLGLFRSWLEILCEAWLLGGGITLVLNFALVLPGLLVESRPAALDVIQLSLALFAASALLLVGRDLFGDRSRLAALIAATLVLRSAMWVLAFFATSLDLPVLESVARMLHLGAWATVVLTVLEVRRSRWTPGYERRVFTGARMPYAVALVVVGVALITRTVSPQLPRIPVIIIGGGFVVALLARQLVTNSRLREEISRSLDREAYFRSVVQDTNDVVLICDQDGRLEYLSPAAERVIGTRRARSAVSDPGSTTLTDLLGCDPGQVHEALTTAGKSGEARFEVRRSGQVLESLLARRDRGFVVTVRDVTERDLLRERLHELAYTDMLTGLPNRLGLVEHLDHTLTYATDPTKVCVVYLDLDRFKQVNDSAGHTAGDALLQEVADRVVGVTGPERYIARLGGDEFVVVAERGIPDATALARRIHSSIVRPFTVGDRVHQVGVSIGVAVGTAGLHADEMLHRADLAMYSAKESRASWALYHPGLTVAALRRADEDHELARTWRPDSVRLHLQPIVRTDTLDVVSVEALLRWRLEDGSVVGPARVLDYAERTGQLTRLTGWTLSQATRTMSRLGAGAVPVALNLPASLLEASDLPDRLARIIGRGGLLPADVHLELTEEAMVNHDPRATQILQNLRAEGYQVFVDDFGTGYSALSYLVHLPVDGIKIDRAFVRELPSSRVARSIVAGVAAIGADLGLTVVAEGVETAAEAAWVARLGVRLAQGFWYARPQDAVLLPRTDDLAMWGDALGEGGVRHTASRAPASFALGEGEC